MQKGEFGKETKSVAKLPKRLVQIEGSQMLFIKTVEDPKCISKNFEASPPITISKTEEQFEGTSMSTLPRFLLYLWDYWRYQLENCYRAKPPQKGPIMAMLNRNVGSESTQSAPSRIVLSEAMGAALLGRPQN